MNTWQPRVDANLEDTLLQLREIEQLIPKFSEQTQDGLAAMAYYTTNALKEAKSEQGTVAAEAIELIKTLRQALDASSLGLSGYCIQLADQAKIRGWSSEELSDRRFENQVSRQWRDTAKFLQNFWLDFE